VLGVHHHHKAPCPKFLTHLCCTQVCEHVKTTHLAQDTSTCLQQAERESFHCDVSYYGQSGLKPQYKWIHCRRGTLCINLLCTTFTFCSECTCVWHGPLKQKLLLYIALNHVVFIIQSERV